MILDRLTLYNVGVYNGEQTVELTPPSRDKPVILVGALNGGGKTTILESLQLGLLGEAAKFLYSGGTYHGYLKEMIHRGVKASDGAAITISFRSTEQGKERQYEICRQWTANGNNRVKEHLEVIVDGEMDRVLADSWSEQVGKFIPARLSPLFFFDGEKIKSLADPTRSAQILKSAMDALMGLDLVTHLEADLKTRVRQKREEVIAPAQREIIETKKQEWEAADEAADKAAQELASLRSELDKAEERKAQSDEEFSESGGSLIEKRKEFESRRELFKAELTTVKEDLLKLASGILPLKLLEGLLQKVADQSKKELGAEQAEITATVLEDRDSELLQFVDKLDVPTDARSALNTFLNEDRDRRSTTAETECWLKLPPAAQHQTAHLLSSGLADQASEARKLLDRHESIAQSIDELDRRLSEIPDDDSIANLIRDREKTLREYETGRDSCNRAKESLRQLQWKRDALREELDKLLKENAEHKQEHLKTHRFIEYAEQIPEVLRKFQKAALKRHLGKYEEEIAVCYKHLLRKKSLLAAIKIDPDSYEMSLVNSAGDTVPTDRLSAGERQLLAVSTLWALARSTERSLPVVIDTPLGRLDSSHRANLVERYFPKASHQVILLSTDEEIYGDYYKALKDAGAIGHEYLIEYDDKTETSKIHAGYFSRKEAVKCP